MPRDLTTARRELDDARATLTALQEQVRDGDDSVTPEQIATQRELITFAELRVEAAQRTETRMREQDREDLGTAAKHTAEQLITGSGPNEIAAATRAAVDALAHLTRLVNARNQQITEVGTTLTQLDEDLKVAGVVTGPWGSQRYGVWGDRKNLVVPGVGTAPALPLGDLTVGVVAAGVGVDADGREAADRHMHKFHGLRDQGVGGFLEAYPWLGEAFRVTEEEFEAADGRGKAMLTEQGRRPLPSPAD